MDKFPFNLEVLIEKYNIRKDNIKRRLTNFGFKENVLIQTDISNQNGRGGHNKQHVYLSSACFKQLDCNFMLTTKRDITIPEVHFIKRYLPKETEILDFIYKVLSPLYKPKKQYNIGKYYIDLYIEDKKLAIECDEHNHKGYDQNKEESRQNYIETQLDCEFMRFNPDDKEFKLSGLLSNILMYCSKTCKRKDEWAPHPRLHILCSPIIPKS
jgi:very-short-patch-repair endonuclease